MERLILIVMLSLMTGIHLSGAGQGARTDSLLRIAETADDKQKAEIYMEIAGEYYGVSLPEYYRYAALSRRYALRSGNEKAILDAMMVLGISYHFMGKPDSAIDCYTRALEIQTRQRDTVRMIKILRNIGISYQDMEDYRKAAEFYQRALVLSEAIRDSSGMINVLFSIADAYTSELNFQKSVETSMKALRIAESIGDKFMMSKCLGNLSITFGMMEDYEKALSYQKQSLACLDTLKNKRDAASSYSNIGLIYKKMGSLDSAEIYYYRSLRMKKEIGDMNSLATIFDNIGSLHVARKQYHKALEVYLEALRLAEENHLRGDQLLLVTDIGEVYYLMKDYPKAGQYLQKGLDLLGKGASAELKMRLYENLYKLKKETGAWREAVAFGQKYYGLKDSLFALEKQKELHDIETRYQTKKKEDEIMLLTRDKELQDVRIRQQRVVQFALAGISLLLLALAALLFSRFRLKQQNIRNKLEKEKLETEGKLLRSQMNPHFIYNSMNSVQSFISSNEPLKAMTYLSKFGQLTRDVLEHSRKEFVTLEEEIESLTVYMELESLRLSDKVTWSIVMDDKVDRESTLIPPMMIQPFVENAFKHGLGHGQAGGRIELEFATSAHHLICRISDNGIGREASAAGRDATRQSLGMQITRERMEDLRNRAKSEANFEITDLRDSDGNPSGTMVVVKLPLLNHP